MEILYLLIASFCSWTNKLEEYLNENFHIPPKNASVEALERWRKLCRGTVKNPRRRFRYTAKVEKRLEAEAMRRTNLVAKENADVIIVDDNFTTIVNVAKWGRAVYINIQKFVQLQLTANVVAVMINFASVCISGSAALTVVQLLWVNLIVDTLGAVALATGPPNDGLMNRPPVWRGVNFITKAMWRNIIGQSIYQLSVVGVLNFYGKNLLGLEGSDVTEVLNTFIFSTFVFCQVFNEINSRDIEKINVFCGMFDSWIFIAVVLSTVTLQVIIVQFQGILVSSVPLSCQLWLLSILLGAVSMLVAVVFKCILLKKWTPKHHDDYEPLPSGQDIFVEWT